jgi:mannosyl-glycoprotein endo-beta-N-acetylglucosaminidase
MHLNINLSGGAQTHFRRSSGCGQSQMSTMMRMMMQMMQMFTGHAGGNCQMGRPNFGGDCGGRGGGFQGGPCGSPVGNFLGSQGRFQAPCQNRHSQQPQHFAPPCGNWQSAGGGGNWGGRLPGPLQQHSGAFEHYGQKYGVDPKFLAAISMLETGSGTSSAFRNKNNAMGVSNSSGPIAFGSVDQSIERMARVLAKRDGPYAGRQTIGQIAGVYCPVGAGNDVNGTNHHWPSMVSKFYSQLGGNPSAAVKV